MTTQTLYRFRCDGPHCTTTALADDLKDTPDGWRIIESTDHIPVPPPRDPWARGRRSTGPSYTVQCQGAFTLHLCPEHQTVFDGHLPRTDGIPVRAGRDAKAYVSCSCGMQYVLSGTGWRIAAADMSGPAAYTENVWWRHLPAELQWYAQRDQQPA